MGRRGRSLTAAPRQPMLWAALAFSLGILIGSEWWRPPAWWAVAALLFAVSATLLQRRRPRWALLLMTATLVAGGALSYTGRSHAFHRQLQAPSFEQFAQGDEVVVTGVGAADGVVRRVGSVTRQVIDIDVESIEKGGEKFAVRTRLRLGIYSRDRARDFSGEGDERESAATRLFRQGERVRFTDRLRTPRNFGNPGAWDYRAYLAGLGITLTGSVGEDDIEVLGQGEVGRLERWRSDLRRSIVGQIHGLWDERGAALADAILIGEKSYLERPVRTDFQRAGIYHVLVVSGMHVGILALVVFWVVRRVGGGELAASVVTLAVAAGYAFLANAGTPVIRATLMLAVGLGARFFYRERALVNALGMAALVLLLADPLALFDASFQLTFLSVLAIVAVGVPWLDRTSMPYRRALRHFDSSAYDVLLPPNMAQLRLDLRLIFERLRPFVGRRAAEWSVVSSAKAAVSTYDVVVVSAIVQVSLALPMAIYFHRATLQALPANILAVPLTVIHMPLALVAIGVSYVSGWMASPFALTAGWMLEAMAWSAEVLGTDVRVATPGVMLSAAGTSAFVIAAICARRRTGIAFAGLGAITAVALWMTLVPPRPQFRVGVMEITAVDVGQADAILVVTPDGRTLLVDAAGSIGPGVSEFDFGEDVISPYLWNRGITRLDAVALTHAHSDHMGGMRSVLTNFRPREFWVGASVLTPGLRELLKQASEQGTAVIYRKGGEELAFGQAKVQVLSPAPDWKLTKRVRNDDSLVFRIAYKDTAAVLAADAERRSERWMVAQSMAKADLLKVAHNGSVTSTSVEFLNAVQPQWAVISVGFRNQFRHPRREVLERLQAAGVTTYRTDLFGKVTFYLDGEKVVPENTR